MLASILILLQTKDLKKGANQARMGKQQSVGLIKGVVKTEIDRVQERDDIGVFIQQPV